MRRVNRKKRQSAGAEQLGAGGFALWKKLDKVAVSFAIAMKVFKRVRDEGRCGCYCSRVLLVAMVAAGKVA